MNVVLTQRIGDRPDLTNPSKLITRSFQQTLQYDWITNLFSSFLLDHIIVDAIAMISRRSPKRARQINLEANLAAVVYADQDMVYAMIYHLITSAIAFSCEDETINISSQVIQNTVTISISSSGMGISEEKLQNLFQIDTTPVRLAIIDETLTGIELLVCHRFAEKNHGKLLVISGDDQGKMFMITLPKSLHSHCFKNIK